MRKFILLIGLGLLLSGCSGYIAPGRVGVGVVAPSPFWYGTDPYYNGYRPFYQESPFEGDDEDGGWRH